MITTLWAVLGDLWGFALGRSTAATQPTQIRVPKVDGVAVERPVRSETMRAGASQVEGMKAFVLIDQTPCLQGPEYTFDTVRGRLLYGQTVRITVTKEQWLFVEAAAVQGWVPAHSVTTTETDIFPVFIPEQTYDANAVATKQVREYLRDQSLGGALTLPLQPTEYVLYRLARAQKQVTWPAERPRLPGRWQTILAGKRGVTMGPEAKTGAILESGLVDGSHFLGFVESVAPDLSLVVSLVGRTREGEYEVLQVPAATWQTWQPVFISIT